MSLVLAAALTLATQSGGQPWLCFAGSPQHRSISSAKPQPLNRILWSSPVDISPSYEDNGTLTAHYGSPVITKANTVIIPVKTGPWDGFQVEARNGATGALLYTVKTDYSTVSAQGWIASFNPALSRDGKLFTPAAGGTLLVTKNADKGDDIPVRSAFFGFDNYKASRELYNETVKICTPITVDGKGNAWFGFRTLGNVPDETPIGSAQLVSGIGRVDANGNGTWLSVKVLAGDMDAMHVEYQCAPALSDDESILYFAVQLRNGGGYLIGMDTAKMATKYKARLLDPSSGGDAILGNQSTSSPTIGLDGDVFFGVLSNPEQAHNKRGFLLHFDKTLTKQKITGSFGWDTTASIIPTSAFSSYKGKSDYFVITKYNNYALFGDGDNRVALLDPNAFTSDPLVDVSVMNELEVVSGPTADPKWQSPDYPDAVYEWCINAAAVDPSSACVIANSEDGRLYRWDLHSNKITEGILLDGPRGQAYTPTVIGPTGIVYAINNGRLFAVGR